MAVDHLRRAGRLDAGQEYFDIDDWFNAELPNPPFYSDGNSIGATTWFKTPVPRVMLEKIQILQRTLSDHDVPDEISSSDAISLVFSDLSVSVVQPGYSSPFQAGAQTSRSRCHRPRKAIRTS